jgi:ribonucleoside-triphosphate reductase
LAIIENTFISVKKRDGRTVPFDPQKIKNAVAAAMEVVNDSNENFDIDTQSGIVRDQVVQLLQHRNKTFPTIEEIQDVVEEVLVLQDYPKTAKNYIIYRNERAKIRETKIEIPDHVKNLVARSKEYFQDDLGEFTYFRTYARWIEEEQRRETWIETVDRYMSFMRENLDDKLDGEEYAEVHQAILNMEVLPSMRLLWAAGSAARADNAAAYNCAFCCPTTLRSFGEILYILMVGAGVGFSVEAHVIQQLPIINYQIEDAAVEYYEVADSKAGWADALIKGLETWYAGRDITFDLNGLRPMGARLKTMGGKSSGPAPLKELLDFARAMILSRQGKRLTSLNVHDLICKIGEIVVVGGVRRSSLISLSDLDDLEMRDAKQGHFFLSNPHRQLANNSVAYKEKPSQVEFLDEWLNLAKSGSGERGIFNRGSLRQQIPSRRLKYIEPDIAYVGYNPCGEINLRSNQFCNLTSVVLRDTDTLKDVKRKVRIAAILGTYQSTLTNFPYLSEAWKNNCEEERLLGVSLNGHWDSPIIRKVDTQRWAKAVAGETNVEYAQRFGVNPSTAITCVKPEGTGSVVVNSASGMHPRYAKYYIRRIRISTSDSLFKMIRDQKYPFTPDTGQSLETMTTAVIDFPVKAPEGSVTRHDLTALDQLEYWKQVKENYTEHNPSQTIYVNEDEWLDVGHWVYKNWDIIGGLSFLPKDNGVYRLAPHEEISKDKYEQMVRELPKIDFAEIMQYEKEDNTEGAKTLACFAGNCDV